MLEERDWGNRKLEHRRDRKLGYSGYLITAQLGLEIAYSPYFLFTNLMPSIEENRSSVKNISFTELTLKR
jgi:hypothetical protein